MKIGPVEVSYRPGNSTVGEETLNFLTTDYRVTNGVARMARSEVKNYLAELAEGAEMPFSTPEAFLASIRLKLTAALLAEKQADNHVISIDELERRRQAASNLELIEDAFVRGDN